MTSGVQPDGTGDRIHALDAVRGGALLLGVAFHATMSFLPGPQMWVVRDAADPLLGALFIVSHMFRMTLFFLIAGFFARLLVERRGTRGFVADRAKRIALPLVIFWLPLLAAIIAAFVWGLMAMNGGAMPANPPPAPQPTLATFPWTHLWFLYLLLLFYLVALPVRLLPSGAVDRVIRLAVEKYAALPLLALPLFIAFVLRRDWVAGLGIPTPDAGFVPNAVALTAYGTAFAFGWLLHRNADLLRRFARSWALHLALAVAASAALIWMLGSTVPLAPAETDPTRKAVMAGIYAVATWAWTLGLLGAAMRFLTGPNAAIRYCADASYWIYLVHLPVVMALQVLVYPVAAPAIVKFALVLTGSFLILFASYHLLVRHSWLGRWLNGRKYPWRRSQDVGKAVPA